MFFFPFLKSALNLVITPLSDLLDNETLHFTDSTAEAQQDAVSKIFFLIFIPLSSNMLFLFVLGSTEESKT